MKQANFKKYGSVMSQAAWEHQHPDAPGRVSGVLAQAEKKYEHAKTAVVAGLAAAVEMDRAEHDLNLKKSGKTKFRSAKSWLIDYASGKTLTPEEYIALRGPLTEKYGYFHKDRGGKRKGELFVYRMESAALEEFAIECMPYVSYALQAADSAGHDVGAAVDFLFDGVPAEFERVTGFKVVFRCRHTDEGILHDQLIWAKTDGSGRKLGLRPNSTRWAALQGLKPAMIGARRWRNLVGKEILGPRKSDGIDAALRQRKEACNGVFTLPPDAALADYVDGRIPLLREQYPWLVPFIDKAEKEYRASVELKLGVGMSVDEIFEREASARAELEAVKSQVLAEKARADQEAELRKNAEQETQKLREQRARWLNTVAEISEADLDDTVAAFHRLAAKKPQPGDHGFLDKKWVDRLRGMRTSDSSKLKQLSHETLMAFDHLMEVLEGDPPQDSTPPIPHQ